MVKGKRIQIRPMTDVDLEGDTEWACRDPDKLREDYEKSQEDPQLRVFVVLNEEGARIGRIEYRGYRPAQRRTQCNIYLMERYTNQGYGTDALETFSAFLFETLEIDAIGLMVNAKNKRAIRCYQKCGYEIRHEFPGKKLLIMVLERENDANERQT